MSKVVLAPGVLAGVLLGLAFVALAAVDDMSYGAREAVGLAAMAIVLALAQTSSLKAALRDQAFGGRAAYAPRYFVAMLTGATAAVTYGTFTWINFTFFDTGYLDDFHHQYLERARAEAASPAQAEQLASAAEQMKDFITDPLSQAMVQFGTVLMIGLLTGLLVAAFRKR